MQEIYSSWQFNEMHSVIKEAWELKGDPEGSDAEQDDGNMFEMSTSFVAEDCSPKIMMGLQLAEDFLSASIMIEQD